MSTTIQPVSAEDLLRMPDDGFRYELVRGELRKMSRLTQKRLEEVGDIEGYWPGAPNLVIEVISPGDTYAEVEEKVFEWLDAGTRMVVVVNPRKRAVTVYRSLTDIVVLTENETLDGGDVVPGWSMTVKDIFA
ncbi:MAG TPA: Uma2 family endonuclease [Blastocatellia bacterium]|nr:Uma2 family endonuclease [Blastocatellia bacterium]